VPSAVTRDSQKRPESGANIDDAPDTDRLFDLRQPPREDRKARIEAVVLQLLREGLFMLNFEILAAEQLTVAAATDERRVEVGIACVTSMDVVAMETKAKFATIAA
jgi:hypothetical protein